MFKIYHTNTLLIKEKYSLEELLASMPIDIQNRARRYRFEHDGYQFVIGRLLLKYGLREMGRGDLLDQIIYLDNDKPYLDDISFNISHSGNLVVCILAEQGQIGIDIEQHKQVNLSDFEAFFTQKEWLSIIESPLPLRKFFCYWTRKESIIKALGVNLSYLHQIEIDASKNHFLQNGQSWFLQDLEFGKGIYASLCTDAMGELQKIEVPAELLCR